MTLRRPSRTRKPKALKRKAIEAIAYNDGHVGIVQMYDGRPMSLVAFNNPNDLRALAVWLIKVSVYLKAKGAKR